MKKRKLIRPTPDEDRLINEGIAADPDTYELGDDFFRNAKPATRGKQKSPTKIRTSVRFSPEVIETYRGLGKGWQTRMDEDLKELLERKYIRKKKDGHLVTLERISKNPH